jgi:AraC-like DNA-binding protein
VDNRYFSTDEIQLLCTPERWHVIASACPPEAAPLADPAHQGWARGHGHAHPYLELMLVLRGQGRYGTLGAVYPCLPGTLLIFAADELHDLGCPPWAREMVFLQVSVLADAISAAVVAVGGGRYWPDREWRLHLGPDMLTRTHGLCAQAWQADYPPAYRRLCLRTAVAGLVGDIVRRGWETSVLTAPSPAEVVALVQQYLRTTGGKGATLASLATLTGYSPFHFARLFRRHTGQTVHQYLDQCRARLTQEWLNQGLTRAEISARLGFSAPSAFSRWWRGVAQASRLA